MTTLQEAIKAFPQMEVWNDSCSCKELTYALENCSASGATTEPENPAKQQFSFQLPFLPGPYSKTPPPGTTVGQQIMINLGVGPDVLMTAITQKN